MQVYVYTSNLTLKTNLGMKVRLVLLFLVAASAVARSEDSANLGGVPSKRLKMQYATGLLLKFQICVS